MSPVGRRVRRGEVRAGQSAAAGEATVQHDRFADQLAEVHLLHRLAIADDCPRRIHVCPVIAEPPLTALRRCRRGSSRGST